MVIPFKLFIYNLRVCYKNMSKRYGRREAFRVTADLFWKMLVWNIKGDYN